MLQKLPGRNLPDQKKSAGITLAHAAVVKNIKNVVASKVSKADKVNKVNKVNKETG